MSEELSKQDKRRVNNCEYYQRTKQVMKNAEVYKELEVGEVYYIKCKDYEGKEVYHVAGWNNDPAKYMVFHKDGGFVFVKRIIANGKVGKEVTCLTTTFNVDDHWLEADPDYVNSILLDNEEGYDPLAASKKLASNKNKARRRNKKIEVIFKNENDAFNYANSFKVGDCIYDAETSYGAGIVTWEVTNIIKRKTDKKKPTDRWARGVGSTDADRTHNSYGLKDLVAIDVKIKGGKAPKTRRWIKTSKTITFYDFLEKSYNKWYKSKPYTVDDV